MSAHPLWRGDQPLVLASTSHVRRTLLEAAGIPVETAPSGVDERARERGLGRTAAPGEVALHLATAKAETVAALHPGRLVVGADQVLEYEGKLYPKPGTPDEARRQLERLAGRRHVLHSAAVALQGGQTALSAVETASLTLRPLTEAEIAAYVEAAGDAATRSAGGYEIEGLGIHLFAEIEGEHSTILGLPLLPVLAALRRLGMLAL